MKRYTFFLIFLVSFIVGIFIELASSGGLIKQYSPVAYAPSQTPPIDYHEPSVLSGDKININTASIRELDLLYGIGEEYAMRIIKYRNISGKFEVPEDIMKVPGIGENRFMKIKDKISVE